MAASRLTCSFADRISDGGSTSKMTSTAEALARARAKQDAPYCKQPGDLGKAINDKNFIAACELGALPGGEVRAMELGGISVLLCRRQDRIFAVINKVQLRRGKLECGQVKRGGISCPVHG